MPGVSQSVAKGPRKGFEIICRSYVNPVFIYRLCPRFIVTGFTVTGFIVTEFIFTGFIVTAITAATSSLRGIVGNVDIRLLLISPSLAPEISITYVFIISSSLLGNPD